MGKRDKVRDRLIAIVNAKYSVPTWLWVICSTAAALIILIGSLTLPAAAIAADPFLNALPINGTLWGGALAGAGFTNMYGMKTRRTRLVGYTSFLCFCLWVFGGIALAASGLANLFFILPMLAFWAYKYVASFVREHYGV